VWTTLRQTYDLVGRDGQRRWLLLIGLALAVSLFEIIGALLVYVLLALVVDPEGSIDLPLVGDLRQLAPETDETTVLLTVVVAIGFFFLLRGALRVGATYVQARVAHNAGARLSNRLVEGYLRWPYVVHLRRDSSELVRNAHTAVLEMIQNVVVPAIKVSAETILVLGMLAVLTAIAPAATAMAVVVVGGAAGVLLAVVQPKLKRLGQLDYGAAQATLGSLQQSLHGVRDIKLLGRERFFARVYGRSRLEMARARYLHWTAAQLPTVVMETALLGFILIFFGLAIAGGGAAQETLSVLGLFAYVGLRLQPSLRDIVAGLNSLKYSSAPLQALHDDLRAVEATEAQTDGPRLPFSSRVRFEGVSLRYEGSDVNALSRIDLEIRAGEHIGICGPTGGGKSTLVDVLTGLLSPTEGRVTVDGTDLRSHARAWQRNLGIVPQMVFLINDTLRRNIALGIEDEEVDEEALAEAVRLAQLEEMVASLPDGLDSQAGERGLRLSGGQRQRIAIARALYARPSVLIFDEGTSALDNATEAQLMHAIEALRGERTVILIAHRLSTVRNSDRVVFLEHGSSPGLGGTRISSLTTRPSGTWQLPQGHSGAATVK
jgi:ATP-binding cassette, subfamily B, bacterial PglK